MFCIHSLEDRQVRGCVDAEGVLSHFSELQAKRANPSWKNHIITTDHAIDGLKLDIATGVPLLTRRIEMKWKQSTSPDA
ncbi:MAG: hypothetical protein HZA46_17125 [Planctomycetales bacterium]|nr:hypothetical protein [Planctomycetales bacterium]